MCLYLFCIHKYCYWCSVYTYFTPSHSRPLLYPLLSSGWSLPSSLLPNWLIGGDYYSLPYSLRYSTLFSGPFDCSLMVKLVCLFNLAAFFFDHMYRIVYNYVCSLCTLYYYWCSVTTYTILFCIFCFLVGHCWTAFLLIGWLVVTGWKTHCFFSYLPSIIHTFSLQTSLISLSLFLFLSALYSTPNFVVSW